jgi:hypothetical protein
MRYELYFSLVSVADDGATSELMIAENLTMDIDPRRAQYCVSDGRSATHGFGNETIETILDYIRSRTTRLILRKRRVRYSRRIY